MEKKSDALEDVDKSFITLAGIFSCLGAVLQQPAHMYEEGYALKEGHRLQQKSPLQMEIPANKYAKIDHTNSCTEAYQANALSKNYRKGIDGIHGWVEPICQPFVGPLERFLEWMNDGEYGAGRVASLELGGKWMNKEIESGAFFINVQGIINYQLEI